ncbi:MAG TPA: hypothetical protein VEH27_11025, partial [Methylomirabilota bacterium]|nr:hypothetical protein [Methylomirabilota bacterium]
MYGSSSLSLPRWLLLGLALLASGPSLLAALVPIQFRIYNTASVEVVVRMYYNGIILQRTAIGPGLSVFNHGSRETTGGTVHVRYGPNS